MHTRAGHIRDTAEGRDNCGFLFIHRIEAGGGRSNSKEHCQHDHGNFGNLFAVKVDIDRLSRRLIATRIKTLLITVLEIQCNSPHFQIWMYYNTRRPTCKWRQSQTGGDFGKEKTRGVDACSKIVCKRFLFFSCNSRQPGAYSLRAACNRFYAVVNFCRT